MDWMLKASPWEPTHEFGRDDFPLLTESSCIKGNKNVELFPVDQGFNRLGDGIVNETIERKGLAQETLSPSGASRRTRGHNGHNQHTSCLVDGCTSDLSSCRDYHRRHRVCELHSKTPVVVIRGKEQRFCQQCSRFHSLGEFDEVKRSCRKRLDGHNRRRRKPHPESLFLSYGNFLANQQGAKLLQFDSPQSDTSTHGSNQTWHNEDKFNQEMHVIVQPSSISSNSKRRAYSRSGNNFPLLLGKGNQPVPEFSVSQQIQDGHASPNCLKKISGKMRPLDKSKGAPSLLSHTPTQTPGTRSSRLMQHDAILMNQPTETSPELDGLAPYSQHRSRDLSGVFHFGHEGLFENEALQLISFSCN